MNIFDYITFLIAVGGFALSIWNFIETRWQNRVNIGIECKDYLYADFFKTKPLFVGLTITNKSRLQISVTRIFIELNRTSYEVSWIPMPVFNARLTQNDALLDSTIVKSIIPPLNMGGLSSVSGYFTISSHGKINISTLQGSDAKITLHTNRGAKSYIAALHQHSLDV